ncbi:MAG: CotH kinase family protein [Eubacteriales bacterium]
MHSNSKRSVARTVSLLVALSMLFLTSSSLIGCFRPNTGTEESDSTKKTSVTAEPGEINDVPVEMEEDPALVITELMVINTVGIKDQSGNRSGWIEIYNRSGAPVNLKDYTLALGDSDPVALPDLTVDADGFAVLFANGKSSSDSINMKLTAKGVLILYHGDLASDKVTYLNANANCSYLPATGTETAQPTPGYAAVKEKDSLIISELMASNDLYPVGGQLCDWVELLNAGENDIDLSNYYASGSSEDLYRCQLPAKVLKPGEYLVLACGRDLSFNLSKDGDSIFITRSDGVLAASLTFDSMEQNTSWTYDMGTVSYPSPGYANTEEGWLAAINDRKGLVISEIISSNSKISPKDGECYDMVELWNNGDTVINLSDYYLSDKSSQLQRYRLPDGTLNPGEVTVVYCDGEKYAPFKISSSGEKLYVSMADGVVVDAIDAPAIPVNYSYGRDSSGKLAYFTKPSFGSVNSEGSSGLTAVPVPSVLSGFYTGPVTLTLEGEGNLYYTLDGSKPTKNSTRYQGETITIEQTAALRVIAYGTDKIPSAVTTYNYFINEPSYTLPIVKISMSNSDFYDDKTGIYPNYNTDLEKEVGFAYYIDGVEQFSVNCGIKVFGASSRQYAKKSYQLKFRSDYGMSKLEYKIFDNLDLSSFNNLVLRSGSQSIMKYRTMMTDELITSLAAYSGNMPGILVQAYKPVNLYINDEYMGIYFIREKIDEDFVANHWNVSPESVTIINWVDTVKYGASDQGWHDIWDFVYNQKADLTDPENYKWVTDQLDIQSMMDVYIMRIWGGDRDSGNIRAVKSPEYDGGKWHFMLFDCDLCFDVRTTKDELEYIMTNSNLNRLHAIFRALMKNEEFESRFLERLGYHMNNTLTPELAQARLDALYNEILPDMPYNIERWKANYHPDMATWQAQVNALRKVIGTQRMQYFVTDSVKTFGLTAEDVKRFFGDSFVEYM